MQHDERARATDAEERAIPVLPARDLVRTRRFYQRLGFRDVSAVEGVRDHHDYLVLRAGSVELHFFLWPELEPGASAAFCDIDTEDADALHRLWSRLGLPEEGCPRLSPIADTPWGRRRFVMVDPDGNRLSCGQRRARPQDAAMREDDDGADDPDAALDRRATGAARPAPQARRPEPAPAAPV
jgi:catechol 2,3-dioxygenase-like lactoylglutathione lyase family enzyme